MTQIHRFTCSLGFVLLSAGLSASLFTRPRLGPSSGVSSGFAEVNGGKIYYETSGAGPAVVLIHGGQLDSRMWDEQFVLFAAHYRVIRYDVRGFGKSPAPTKAYADEEDLFDLLHFLKVDKATIVGLSLGGRIAIDFALAHPEKVRAIIPVAPGLSGFSFSPDTDFWASLEAAQAGDGEKVADLWLKSGYMAPAMGNPKIAPRIRQLSVENAHQFMDNFLFARRLKPPAIERLPQIHAPTLVIVGNRDVNDIHEIAGLLYARIPGAKEIVIAGAGHMVNMEKPEEFNRVVLEFLGNLQRN
jgi:3-oxoadipate enol-lactonase